MIGQGKNKKKSKKVRIAIAVAFLSFIIVNDSMADGGEMRKSQSKKYLVEEQVKDDKLFEDLKEMDYALFLETDVGYGVTLDYYRYGIYGDFMDTTEEGEKVYFDLCEKLLGTKLAMASHEEWADNKVAHIQNLSPDLQWVVAREYPKTPVFQSVFKDKVFHNGQLIEEEEGGEKIYEDNILFDFQAEEGGGYILLDKESLEKKKKIARELLGRHSYLSVNSVSSIDGNGKFLAVAGPSNQEIRIYRLEDEALLYGIIVDKLDRDWPIEISQIVGTENGGWVVFSNGDATYRMDYPNGNAEKIGEYMYGTTYSPDEKYRAYCMGNMELEELAFSIIDGNDEKKYDKYCELYDKWKEIPTGWYIEELESGKKIYIPIDTWKQDDKPLFGGRCVWLEKSRLLEVLER